MAQKEIREAPASPYKHAQESVQRPDVGVEGQFAHKKPPRTYRYDSSLAPELFWDESADRAFAEWLLGMIAEAAEKGEGKVFAEPQVWQGTEERFTSLSQCAMRLRSLTKPFLNWSGKAERQQVSAPTLPLFVHERHSTQAILETLQSHRARGTTLDLFGDVDLDIADKLDAYEHKGPWTNRLVLGDSLQVMNSLLEYEGMGGQVQMLYFDPPYGVKFGSNFQPFVRDNRVAHNSDTQMIREPEMVKAYRDTWELGLHSYLTYLRDRLTIAKEALHPSGSIFLQISDDNIHHVREILDEIFGAENFVSAIAFQKTTSSTSNFISSIYDTILWYARDKNQLKYNPLFMHKVRGQQGATGYTRVMLPDGSAAPASQFEDENGELQLPEGTELVAFDNITSQNPGSRYDVEFKGKIFRPEPGYWKTDEAGMQRLLAEGRITATKNSLAYVRKFSDFPVYPLGNIWQDTLGQNQFGGKKVYVVQTALSAVRRCLLMATDPGDLVLDVTCGSGTTSVVAEQWGRRWIAVDTSRVPIALARQRLLTSVFPWYRLKEPSKGPEGGFVFERKRNRKGEEVGGLVPRVTLKSIVNNDEPATITLSDLPAENTKVTRVSGPFTVEATIQAAMSMEEDAPEQAALPQSSSPRAYLDRMIEVLRQSKTLRLPGNVSLELEGVRPLADREFLHAEGIAKNGGDKTIAIVFGPEDGAIGSEYVFNASTEAMQQGFQQLFLFGFAIQAKAREMLDKLKIPTTYVSVTPDVVMSDLLKTSKTSEIFSITGQPDVSLEPAGKSDSGTPLYRVAIKGLDIFRPDTMETDEVSAENLPCWMLDTNYNGMAFYASQVFFPKTNAWNNLQKSLKGQFEDSVWEHLAGTASELFTLGDKKRIAVKVIDERGNELMVIKGAEGAA